MLRGKYIVLEGPQGVGKTTQLQELLQRFYLAHLPVKAMREPDSQTDLTARAIRRITQDPNFPINTKTEVLLYNAARSQSLNIIKENLEQGINCLVDRNYLTTLATQYYGRGDVSDYQTINNIIKFTVDDMEPDLCIVLDAPVQLLKQRMSDRYQGERFDDLNESFLEKVRAGYLWEAKQRNLPVIFAIDTKEKIANAIWNLVADTLAVRKSLSHKVISSSSDPSLASIKELINNKKILPRQEPPLNIEFQQDISKILNENKSDNINISETEEITEPLIKKTKQGRQVITQAGYQLLSEEITSITGNIYAFTEKLSPVTVAAAMARLSRRGDDMRLILLDEFSKEVGKDQKLLQRIITAYGDDSVQQLAGLHLVIENASNLLTKKLEWGRLAAYLEQSTRYIYFDQKDHNGNYRYYTPEYLSTNIKKQYQKTMDDIFDLYSLTVRKLTDHIRNKAKLSDDQKDAAWLAATRAQACDAARSMLPVATKSTVGIYASAQAMESLIMHLLSDPLQEAQNVGKEILNQVRKVMPVFLERADKPDRGGAITAYRSNTNRAMKQIANELLEQKYDSFSTDELEAVTLVDYYPKNELNLVSDMLYEHTNMPLKELTELIKTWNYQKKVQVFDTYIGERLNRRHKPGRALEKAFYSWDIMCDYGIFRDLQRHRIVNDLSWQELTVRYGYDIPKIIDEAQLSEQYEDCFDKSLALNSIMKEAGYTLEAQYATLLGHKMRWKVTINAREAFHFHELRTSPQGHPGYRSLVLQMHQKVQEVHPMLANAMKFINSDEDPELTRLAAERYSQFKMSQI